MMEQNEIRRCHLAVHATVTGSKAETEYAGMDREEGLERSDTISYYAAMNAEREKILERLRAGLPALKRQFPLHRLALFGSVVRGEASAASDIDILADVEPSIGLDFVTLADRLEELTGHKIDLVSRRAIKPLLWKQIEPELVDV